jgi:hypothetical protein
MSTGAWICTGLICAAVIAPASVFAAAAAKTQLIGSTTSHVGSITSQGQLLTAQTAPSHLIRAVTGTATNTPCKTVYTPPAGKAIVVTQVIYSFGSGAAGSENFGGLFELGCGNIFDQVDTVEAFTTTERTFPVGLPMNGVAINSNGGSITVFLYGYLIDATSLPSAANVRASGTVKSMPARR